MPSRLRNRDAIPVDTVALDGGDFVKMRRWLTSLDRDEINNRLVELNLVEGKGEVDVVAANRVTLMQAIVSWGGFGFCESEHEDAEGEPIDLGDDHKCTPVAITFESLSLLPDSDMQKLLNKLRVGRPHPLARPGSHN
jgi:hypothetical protein